MLWIVWLNACFCVVLDVVLYEFHVIDVEKWCLSHRIHVGSDSWSIFGLGWWRLGFSLGKSVSECFTNKCLCEVLETDFCVVENLNFSVDYARAKCQERIGENDIKIRLTVSILRAKQWKTHFLKSWVQTRYRKNVPRFGSRATFCWQNA